MQSSQTQSMLRYSIPASRNTSPSLRVLTRIGSNPFQDGGQRLIEPASGGSLYLRDPTSPNADSQPFGYSYFNPRFSPLNTGRISPANPFLTYIHNVGSSGYDKTSKINGSSLDPTSFAGAALPVEESVPHLEADIDDLASLHITVENPSIYFPSIRVLSPFTRSAHGSTPELSMPKPDRYSSRRRRSFRTESNISSAISTPARYVACLPILVRYNLLPILV